MSRIATHPAGERNKRPIAEVLTKRLRSGDRVLEIASGPGQHVELLAGLLPAVRFQPSEPDPRMRASIVARAEAAGLTNVALPLALGAEDPWPDERFDAVIAINLVHIVSKAVTVAVLEQASRVLDPGSTLYLYGPYRLGGRHVSPGNADFDEALRARDPQSGIRDMEWVSEHAVIAGFSAPERIAMPANNFSLFFTRLA